MESICTVFFCSIGFVRCFGKRAGNSEKKCMAHIFRFASGTILGLIMDSMDNVTRHEGTARLSTMLAKIFRQG